MIITVDAMGGDRYPDVPIAGALLALRELPQDFSLHLTGDEGVIKQELQGKSYPEQRLTIVHASETISMDEKVESAKRKRNSSIMVGLNELKLGTSQTFISAGNTAAVMALSAITLRLLPGIERPAIAVTMPTEQGPCLVLDVGASVDCTPKQLVAFGIMGEIYAQDVLGIQNPKVALLSIGEEPTKGNDTTRKAHELFLQLKQGSVLNFIGNVEGSDVFAGKADVIVTDGFTGNIILKVAESLLPSLNNIIKKIIHECRVDQKIFALMAKSIFLGPTIGSLKRTFDVEKYGGAQLLGVNGTVIIAHGKSTPKAILGAISAARLAIQANVTKRISEKLPTSIVL